MSSSDEPLAPTAVMQCRLSRHGATLCSHCLNQLLDVAIVRMIERAQSRSFVLRQLGDDLLDEAKKALKEVVGVA